MLTKQRVAILGALYTRAWGPMSIEIYKLIRRKGQMTDATMTFSTRFPPQRGGCNTEPTGTPQHFKISQPWTYCSLLCKRAYMKRMVIRSLQIHHASEEVWILGSSQFLSPPPRRTAIHPDSNPKSGHTQLYSGPNTSLCRHSFGCRSIGGRELWYCFIFELVPT